MTEPAVGNDTWIRRFHPAPEAATRLVCFPHAGGSATFYFPVSATLSPGVEVLTVQYPGRQDRRNEPPIGDIPSLADAVFEALRPWLADRPALFGHSMGSIVAFEVARRMEEHGTPPRVLVASGRRAPSRYRGESVHLRDDEGVLAELRKLSGTDPRLLADEELQRMVLPAIRSDYRAIETYRHAAGAPPLSCPITVFVGDDDSQVTLEEAKAWQEHTAGAFDLHVFEGGHFYLTGRPAATIERLSEVLSDHA